MTASARLPIRRASRQASSLIIRTQIDLAKSETEMRVWKRTVRRIPTAAAIAKSEADKSHNRSDKQTWSRVYSHLIADIYCPFDLGYENTYVYTKEKESDIGVVE